MPVQQLYAGTLTRQVLGVERTQTLPRVYVRLLGSEQPDQVWPPGISLEFLSPTERFGISHDWKRAVRAGIEAGQNLAGHWPEDQIAFRLTGLPDLFPTSPAAAMLAVYSSPTEERTLRVFDASGNRRGETILTSDLWFVEIDGAATRLLVRNRDNLTLHDGTTPRVLEPADEAWFSDFGPEIYYHRDNELAYLAPASAVPPTSILRIGDRAVRDHATRASDQVEALVQQDRVLVVRRGRPQTALLDFAAQGGFEYRSCAFSEGGELVAGKIHFTGSPQLDPSQPNMGSAVIAIDRFDAGFVHQGESIIATVPAWNRFSPDVQFDTGGASVLVHSWPTVWRWSA